MAFHLSCPECAAVFSIEQAMENTDGRRLMDCLKDIQPVVIRPYLRYLKLFKPAKQGLRWSRMLSLTQEIAPLIKAAKIERNHATYAVLPATWADAMNSLVDNPPATLKLPLKGHGYLLSILSAGAEKAAATTERKVEDDRRKPREGVISAPKPISEMDLAGSGLMLPEEMAPVKKTEYPPGWFLDKAYGKQPTEDDTND